MTNMTWPIQETIDMNRYNKVVYYTIICTLQTYTHTTQLLHEKICTETSIWAKITRIIVSLCLLLKNLMFSLVLQQGIAVGSLLVGVDMPVPWAVVKVYLRDPRESCQRLDLWMKLLGIHLNDPDGACSLRCVSADESSSLTFG